jgi:enamine deaminase RidA (YjgF/YER057c/UK114 family)
VTRSGTGSRSAKSAATASAGEASAEAASVSSASANFEAGASARGGGDSLVRAVLPEGWPKPKGYSNGTVTDGPLVHVGGQIGWRPDGTFPDGFLGQVEQTLRNVVAVVEAAGGRANTIARLTWYVTDMDAYRASLSELGPVYRSVMGRHFPAMALVRVVELVEAEAMVEIEAVAVLPKG